MLATRSCRAAGRRLRRFASYGRLSKIALQNLHGMLFLGFTLLQAIANEERAKSDRVLDVPVVGPPKPTRSSRIPRELLGSDSGSASPTAPPARCSGECDQMIRWMQSNNECDTVKSGFEQW